ncbi:MAG: MFS transporter [Acidobacteriia bacterium]|nr:MFS transporter [Terriglobia bacterium]
MKEKAEAVTFRQVLKNKQFFVLWMAQYISNFGDWLAVLALFSLVAFRLHGSPYQVGGIFLAYGIPWALLGPVAGVFVDRWNLKWTMISSDLIRAVLALMLVFAHDLSLLYLLFFGLSAVSCFFMPAQTSAIPVLVSKDELLVANAANTQSIHFNKIISPAVAGFLVAWAGEKVCFYLDALSFVISAALLSRLLLTRVPKDSVRGVRALLGEMREGFRFIWNQPSVRFVTGAMAVTLLAAGAFDALIAVYVRDILHSESQVFGALVALVGLGTIVGALLIGRFAQKWSRAMMVSFGIMGCGVGIFLLAVSATAPVALVSSLALGFAVSAVMIPSQTLVQEETPQAMLGRVSSTGISLMTVFQIVGVSISGKVANWTGVRALYDLIAVFLVVMGAAGYLHLRTRGVTDPKASTPEGLVSE